MEQTQTAAAPRAFMPCVARAALDRRAPCPTNDPRRPWLDEGETNTAAAQLPPRPSCFAAPGRGGTRISFLFFFHNGGASRAEWRSSGRPPAPRRHAAMPPRSLCELSASAVAIPAAAAGSVGFNVTATRNHVGLDLACKPLGSRPDIAALLAANPIQFGTSVDPSSAS